MNPKGMRQGRFNLNKVRQAHRLNRIAELHHEAAVTFLRTRIRLHHQQFQRIINLDPLFDRRPQRQSPFRPNQFFINTADNAFLDHSEKSMRGWGYTVFGKIIEGQNIAGAISRVETGSGGPFASDVPTSTITILKMTEIKE